jgi:hypothetical protein
VRVVPIDAGNPMRRRLQRNPMRTNTWLGTGDPLSTPSLRPGHFGFRKVRTTHMRTRARPSVQRQPAHQRPVKALQPLASHGHPPRKATAPSRASWLAGLRGSPARPGRTKKQPHAHLIKPDFCRQSAMSPAPVPTKQAFRGRDNTRNQDLNGLKHRARARLQRKTKRSGNEHYL